MQVIVSGTCIWSLSSRFYKNANWQKRLYIPLFQDLVTRICFVLGNLAALDEESRLALYQEKDSMQALMNVFEHYLQLSFKVPCKLLVTFLVKWIRNNIAHFLLSICLRDQTHVWSNIIGIVETGIPPTLVETRNMIFDTYLFFIKIQPHKCLCFYGGYFLVLPLI